MTYKCGHPYCRHVLTAEEDKEAVEAELDAHYREKHPKQALTGRKLELVT